MNVTTEKTPTERATRLPRMKFHGAIDIPSWSWPHGRTDAAEHYVRNGRFKLTAGRKTVAVATTTLVCGSLMGDDGADPVDQMDALDEDVLQASAAVYANDGSWSAQLAKAVDDEAYGEDFLLVRSVEVASAYEGHGLGRHFLKSVIDAHVPRPGIIVLKPWPISNCKLEHCRRGMAGDEQSTVNALRAYWSVLGFRRIGRTPLYVKSGSYPFPELSELPCPNP